MRRVVFQNWAPASLEWQDINFRVLDDPEEPGEWGSVAFKKSKNPSKAWAQPLVTGHHYEVRWANGGIDPTGMDISLSGHWRETDKSIRFTHNWN